MTVRKFKTDLNKAIGKPYSQQPGRQRGEGTGHIVEKKEDGVTFEIGGYLQTRRYNRNALKLLQNKIKDNLGNETGHIEFSMSAKYQSPTLIFDNPELETPIMNALDDLDITHDDSAEEHSYGYRISMSGQAY